LTFGECFLGRGPRHTLPQEGNPIVQVASLFNQLLQHFPRTEFGSLVNKHRAERAAKGFTCWTQFVSMLFCQLGRADSLREICNGLGCCLERLVHVGINHAPRRSTLSYANEHRPAALFEDLFWTTAARFRDQQALGSRKHKFRRPGWPLRAEQVTPKNPPSRGTSATRRRRQQSTKQVRILQP